MRSEAYARGQLQEVEDALAAALNEQRKAEDSIIGLQKELRQLEAKVSTLVIGADCLVRRQRSRIKEHKEPLSTS